MDRRRKPFGIAGTKPGDQVLCEAGFRGVHEYTGGMVMALYGEQWRGAAVTRPDQVAAFEDHFVLIDEPTVPDMVKRARLQPARQLRDEMIDACKDNGIRVHGPGRAFDAGVCHRIVVEQYALPGDIIVSPTATPDCRLLKCVRVRRPARPRCLRAAQRHDPRDGAQDRPHPRRGDAKGLLSPKDLILHLIGDPYFREEQWRESPTDTCVIQLGGAGLDQWNVDELSVLTNIRRAV